MSGTSLDGIDVALIETDGERITRFGPFATFEYAAADRDLLRVALHEAATLSDRTARPGVLAEAEALITARHAEAVERFLAGHGIGAATVALVGFHGQTVLHDPARRLTVQIGDGAALSHRLGIPVVWDFRAADVAAGGEGAPFAPVFHRALAATAGLEGPVAFLNVGGVANVTFVGRDGSLVAFDTGPGNALLDDWMLQRTGRGCDLDGKTAAAGRADPRILAQLLAHSYLAAPPPKSLDRHSFSSAAVQGLSTADGAATLLHFTARAVAAAVPHCLATPRAWYVCGGGRRNAELMQVLGETLAGAPVEPVEALGFDGDAIEAQAFAFLAVRSADGLPLSFPTTTGVPEPLSGGRMSRPARPD
jgi:anhydro-N-acetylmuramic acid kinase